MRDEIEKEGTRKKKTNKRTEIDEIEVETDRDSKIFPDFGRMCGKSEEENPLISRQLQHMELLRGVFFLFFFNLASFLPQRCGGQGLKARKYDVN